MLSPAEYLSCALDVVERYSLKRALIDWPAFRLAAGKQLAETPTMDGAHEAVRKTLADIGDGHSFFATPAEVDRHKRQTPASASRPSGRIVEGRIGYIHVPPFSSLSIEAMTRFAVQTQELICSLDRASPTGWIVDLRENSGGDMWPMIAGLGPIIGDGSLGAFVAPDGRQESWFYRQGSAGCEGGPICPPPSFLPAGPVFCHVDQPYRLKQAEPSVAVLIGPGTASSGEAVALAFRGRPRARSFGAPTRGLTTGNNIFEMSDGALLFLASVVEADRTGQQFSSSIEPDEVVPDGESNSAATMAAASRWLLRSR